MEEEAFDLGGYTGKWYQLVGYPTFFQKKDNYNTTATYTLRKDGNIDVLNETVSNGKLITSRGIAQKQSCPKAFRVDFTPEDIAKFLPPSAVAAMSYPTKEPNYIIRRIWKEDSEEGAYAFAVVTDQKKESMWLLSRSAHPSLKDYNTVIKYLTEHYDSDKFVLTPHY